MPYPGTTVISFLKHEDAKLLKAFHNFVKTQKLFMSHYALLPISSYHMTIKNLTVAGDNSTVFWFENHFMPNFQKYNEISMVCSSSYHQHEINAKIETIYFRSTFGVELGVIGTIDPPPYSALEPIDVHESIRVLQKRLVDLGSKPEPKDFQYHMTMAYWFSVKPISEADKKALQAEINQISAALQRLITSRGSVLHFGPPILCYFKDMTSFVPL
jgi:hypothetical protein